MTDGSSILAHPKRMAASPPKLSAPLSDAAVLAVFGSVIGLFVISPLALESLGIGYLSSGGGLFAKFHPSTFLALIALALRCLASARPISTAWRLATQDSGCVLLLAAAIVMAIVGTVVTKTPVTPLVDTFVLPVLVLVLLRDLDGTALRWLAIAIGLIMSLNACMALIEVVHGSHFITIAVPEGATADPTRGDAVFDWRVDAARDWRAEGLLGHPLVNGLVTAAFILCLAAPAATWIPVAIRIPVALLETVSMFAFGARAALVLTVLFGGGSAVAQIVRAQSGRPISTRSWAIALLAVSVVVIGALVLGQTGFFDHTIARFSQDSGSASTRVTMFQLANEIPWSGLLFGPDKDVVATAQRIYGLEFGIESAWVGLALTYGLVVTGIAVCGLAAFSVSVMKVGGRGTSLVLSLYFLLVSVAASLSGKITSLAIAVVLIVVFLRNDVLVRSSGRRVSVV